jgi:hypothetical protein
LSTVMEQEKQKELEHLITKLEKHCYTLLADNEAKTAQQIEAEQEVPHISDRCITANVMSYHIFCSQLSLYLYYSFTVILISL